MDINNNQQTNTFVKGMNSDTSDAMLQAEQYRYAENLRLSTNKDSNSGELRLIDGTLPIDKGPWDEIVAMTSIRDILVVIGIKLQDDLTVFNVFKANMSTEPDNEQYGVWQLILANWLPYESEYMSVVGRWESDNNIKLYIADGTNPIMTIRLDKIEQADIDDIKDITIQENWILRPLKISISNVVGALKPAKVQYAYTLYNEGTPTTKLSPLSRSLSLYDTSTKGYSTKEDVESNKAVEIEIPEDEHPELTRICIYRITYFQSGQTPLIHLFYDGERDLFSGIDMGNNEDSIQISQEELKAMISLGIIPKEIESKNDYLFAANIKDIQDTTNKQFKDIDCTALAVGASNAFDITKGYTYNINDWYVPGTTTIGGRGEYFEWNLVYEDININVKNETLDDNRTLRRGEIYRYGVILYNEDGQPSSPKWVADIWVPPADAEGDKWQVFQAKSGDNYTLRRIGVKFRLIKPIEGCTAWLIVRCYRTNNDRINLYQGIIGLPHRAYYRRKSDIKHMTVWQADRQSGGIPALEYDDNSTIQANGFMTTSPVCFINPWGHPDEVPEVDFYSANWPEKYYGYVKSVSNQVMFTCPEYCYVDESTKGALSGKNIHLYLSTMYNTAGMIPLDPNDQLYRLKWGSAKTFGYTDDALYSVIRYNAPVTDKLGDNFKDRLYEISEGKFTVMNRNYITPIEIHHKNSTDLYPKDSIAITHTSYPSVPEYNTFGNGKIARYTDDITVLGDNQQFLNWACGMLPMFTQGASDGADTIKDALTSGSENLGLRWEHYSTDKMDHWYDMIHICPVFYPVATGGKCMVFTTDGDLGVYLHKPTSSEEVIDTHITTANIVNKGVIPYRGFSLKSFEASTFFGNGNVVLEDGGDIDVYDGDTFLSVFTYNASHVWFDVDYVNPQRMITIYSVPLESNINIRAAWGDTFALSEASLIIKWYIQDKAVNMRTEYVEYTLNNDSYLYNMAYSQPETVIDFHPIRYTSISSDIHDTRIMYSHPKTNGENIDSWLTFDTNSFHDVDTRFGLITDLRLFKDKLIFWQEQATGLLNVNEQAIVQAQNGADIILGTGGVAERHNYITTKYGMRKNQHTDAQSDNALYWWDSRNKEILQYHQSLVPLTLTHGLENYINEREEAEDPMIAYDMDFDEVIANVRAGGPIVYKEKSNIFTSVYTFDPKYSAMVNGQLYLSSKDKIYKWNANDSEQSVLFGEVAYPKLQYVVNQNAQYNKTFDIQTFGGRFYGGGEHGNEYYNDNTALEPLQFEYKTPLKQKGSINGLSVSNREYDFRLDIPRDNQTPTNGVTYGGRLRGKTMQCELSSTSNSTDFSLQYVITKYRMSWS